MKNLIKLSCLLVCLAACGVVESKLIPSRSRPRPLLVAPKNIPQPKIVDEPKKALPQEFTITWSDLALAARVDESGSATILNYPSEWRGKVRLVRFDGGILNNEKPFSESFCKEVRNSVKNGIGSIFIRNFSYRSLISFDIPVFLPNRFITLAQDVAKSFGIFLAYPVITNGLYEAGGFIELKLSDNAISNIVGDIDILKDQLNFNVYGMENDVLLRRRILINAGDLVCDLISGEATVAMVYPIIGEDRTIKLTYDPLTVELQ